ncbi:hypothetical protein BJ878DRAFT_417060 [Calycina marina]|uniref:ribonuclease Z n=1 Tax=Calycina marina TaxID=1763456 RepID=A0A9P7Z6A9_9HELO|nr:hypothetical protein BJ878DRAFT_417060 [Calycina marina]
MKYWIQFLTTPTADTPGTTMYLHFDSKRYLIGHCAEGTQRAVVENKLGLTKMSDLLLTGKLNWDTAGGVLGMVLTLADSTATMRGSRRAMEEEKELRKQVQIAKGQKVMEPKVEKSEDVRPFLNIHGGENLTHLLATSRRFVFRKGMPVHTQEFTPKNTVLKEDCAPTWKDNLINVWAVALEPDFRRGRKRSHDEITQEDIDAEDIQNQQRKGVLADMFDSEWRLDTLVVKKLSQVELPAKIFVRDDKNKIVEYTGPPAKDVPVTEPDIDVLVRNPWPGALVAKLPSTTPSHTSVSYFIKGHTQRGKFDPAAATALGCERKQFRQLTAGEEVTTSIGTVVRPEQVMAPSQSGGGLAVFDLPDTSYVGPAIERKEWFSKDVMDGIGAVVWILGPGVVDDARLQTFMKERSELKHIVSSQETCPNNLSMHAAAEAAINLHLIDEERFPIPVHSNASTRKPSAIYDVARVGKTIQLAPAVEVNDDNIKPYLDTGKSVLDRDIEVADLAKEALGKITDAEYLEQLTRRQEDIPSRDAEVITLGTGSALPSKYRNVSATLLHVPGYGSYLFDCGENTLGQLKRVLGPELPDVLRDLKAIWISHLHADHHLGTAAVVKAWHKETQNDPSTKDNKLIIASDRDMLLWLQEYAEVDDYGYNRLNTIAFGGHEASDFRYRFSSKEEKTYGLSCIQSCYVKHCRSAMAVVFDFPNGFRVAYSGDCRPSDYFARIGEDATLLIHEATFDDELRTDALAKNHSTTSEAMTVGLNMNARRILLTHFSQRYQKIPVLGENNRDQVAIVAFDYMRCKIGDFAKVDAFRPALMKLYEEETGEIVKRKEKAKQAKPDED